MKSRLYQRYVNEVRPALVQKRGYKNAHQVPRLEKIVINMGVSAELRARAAITGRKPVIAKSRKSIANFKLRLGQPVGCHVTLRRDVMYEFLDRLISVTLPRIRDFRGMSPRAFDGRGNYSLGLAEQTVFPEIELDKIKRPQGMDVTLVTSARSDEEGRDLLKLMGFPFAEK
jgi:large subunit ribosomal protein L5